MSNVYTKTVKYIQLIKTPYHGRQSAVLLKTVKGRPSFYVIPALLNSPICAIWN